MAALMLQGTGSDVGKSLLVAGLCRALANRGLMVRPFKPQNMANNSALTADGGEIGRAQALQAMACRTPPHSDMNPVLLKPQADHRSQLILHGRPHGLLDGRNFRTRRQSLLPEVLASWQRLKSGSDIVIVEGAGSPAEINLRAGDIANMGFARAADVPVILMGDIDRGGVIASLVGTRAVLDPADAAMIRGFIINRFRGDVDLFTDGYQEIEALSGWRGFGILPWIAAASRLPAEDGLPAHQPATTPNAPYRIACPLLPRIANSDAFDPLRLDPGIEFSLIPPGVPIPAPVDLILLPDSAAVLDDLQFLRAEGWDIDIRAHHRRGGRILGIGAGWQMLGRSIHHASTIVPGLGLLNCEAWLHERQLQPVAGQAMGVSFQAVEIRSARMSGADCARPLAHLKGGRPHGAMDANGQVMGCAIQHPFADTGLRAALQQHPGSSSADHAHDAMVDQALDDVATAIETHIDVDGLLALSQRGTYA